MDIPRVSSSVRRITVLEKDASGHLRPTMVYKRGTSKGKKGTWPIRYFERVTRRIADAQAKSGQSYLSRHVRSNRKEKDGWARDFPVNVIRASQKGTKALKLDRLFSF
jgi:hypothetical protein